MHMSSEERDSASDIFACPRHKAHKSLKIRENILSWVSDSVFSLKPVKHPSPGASTDHPLPKFLSMEAFARR